MSIVKDMAITEFWHSAFFYTFIPFQDRPLRLAALERIPSGARLSVARPMRRLLPQAMPLFELGRALGSHRELPRVVVVGSRKLLFILCSKQILQTIRLEDSSSLTTDKRLEIIVKLSTLIIWLVCIYLET